VVLAFLAFAVAFLACHSRRSAFALAVVLAFAVAFLACHSRRESASRKLATKLRAPSLRFLFVARAGNPKSARKDFDNPNIIAQFDKAYTLKK
jgi:hypothetical protein